MHQPNLQVVALCDVYQPNLDEAMAKAGARGQNPRAVRDFREILADKSIDVVNISTPDHWHAYMTVEACKAGKDVYVEKSICVVVEEGRKMVEAARKYNRVVQAGTMQRSTVHFQEACDMVRRGELGKVTFVRTWNYGHSPAEGIGNPPDSDPPPGLDWNMWLGPAPMRPFNRKRFRRGPRRLLVFPLVLGLCRGHDDGLGACTGWTSCRWPSTRRAALDCEHGRASCGSPTIARRPIRCR
jgi:hypothetical protein